MFSVIRHQVKETDKPATRTSRARSAGLRMDTLAWWGCLLAIIAITTVLRTYKIATPPTLVWDELHFLRFSQKYLEGAFFNDVHPPLGMLIISALGYLSGQNSTMDLGEKHFTFKYPQDEWYIFMRLGIAVFGVVQVAVSYLIAWEISGTITAACIAALLVMCDSASTTFNRLVLLDPILLAFILLSVYSSIRFWKTREKPFSSGWWGWMCCTGVMLGCTVSVKYVGSFVVAMVGIQTICDLWSQYCRLSNTFTSLAAHFLARVLGLVLIPLTVYLATFVVRLQILDKGAMGDGIGHNSAEFRLSFRDHPVGNSTPAVVAYGSQVTLLAFMKVTGYLSTSYDFYPPEVGAEQQVIALEANIDELNVWGFKRPDEGRLADVEAEDYVPTPVKHGDYVRLLNNYTERHLHSHRVRGPVTTWMYQVTGFGELDEFHEGGVWRLLLADPDAEVGVTPLQTVTSRFRLVHNNTGCVLRPGLSRYPEWGFNAWEVVCDPRGVKLDDPDQLWQIDENINPKLPGVDLKSRYQQSVLERIIETHLVAFTINQRLKIYKFEGEDGMQKLLSSEPWMWPILYRGCPGHATNLYSLYFVGSPQVYFLNLVVLLLLPLLYIVVRVREARSSHKLVGADVRTGIGYLTLGWLIHYLPFWPMRRILYFHQYLSAFLFSSLLTAVVVDGLIGKLEGLALPLGRRYCRATLLAAITAFLASSYLKNWELAYGVPGDGGTTKLYIKDYFYFDTWRI